MQPTYEPPASTSKSYVIANLSLESVAVHVKTRTKPSRIELYSMLRVVGEKRHNRQRFSLGVVLESQSDSVVILNTSSET